MVKPAPSKGKGRKAHIGKAKKAAKAPAKKMKKKNIPRRRQMKGKTTAKGRKQARKKAPAKAKRRQNAKIKRVQGKLQVRQKSKPKKTISKKANGVKMKAKQKPTMKAKQKSAARKASKSATRAKVPANANAAAMKSSRAPAGAKAAKIPVPPKERRKPRCIVLAGFGLNAEAELAHAFSLAGADAKIVHFSDIASGKEMLEDYEIFAIPGGWSFGDDIAGGRVLSNKLKHTFKAQFEAFASSGKPMLGICNGFQTLAKLGALPNISGSFSQESTLTFNRSGRFEDRWVHLKPQKSVCKYFEGVPFISCPVRHGEGQFVPRDKKLLDALARGGMVPIKYCSELLDDSAGYPANPNGSVENIAGICDPTGKILGLMPHPEVSVMRTQFPRFTAGVSFEKNSLRFFQNIVSEGKRHVKNP